jgi:transmembrane sensor
MNSSKEKWACIARYFANECSDEERVRINKWIDSDPQIKLVMTKLRNVWKTTEMIHIGEKLANIDVESEWKILRQKMSSLDNYEGYKTQQTFRVPSTKDKSANELFSKPYKKGEKSARITSYRQLLRVAAVLIVMFGGGYLVIQWLYTDAVPVVTDMESATQYREITTKTSQLASLELLDGSKVNISVESSLQLSDLFNKTVRELNLEGEAYFNVISDPTRPFVVKTSHAVFTVMGTDFVVRSYPDDEYVRIVVVSGSVSMESWVGNGLVKQIINPGEMGMLNKISGKLAISDVDTEKYLYWISRRIVFEETPLDQVGRDLERWFGITFEILQQDHRHLRLTAVLESSSLNNVLGIIGHTLDLEYEIHDDKVIIK